MRKLSPTGYASLAAAALWLLMALGFSATKGADADSRRDEDRADRSQQEALR